MDRASVTSGAAFKTAVRGTLILLAVLILSGTIAYFYLQRQMLAVLEEQISEDRVVLMQVYEAGGEAGLVAVINTLSHPLRTKPFAVGLFDGNGERLAGTFDIDPDLIAWSRKTLILTSEGAEQDGSAISDFYVNKSAFDEFTLVIGRDLTLVESQERRLIMTFALIGLVVSSAFLLLGYGASSKTLQQLGGMAVTLDRVSQGETQSRLEISPHNDQIDRVSRAMNAHLDRLSVLMQTTKSSAAAIAHDLRMPLSRAFLLLDRAQSAMDAGTDPRTLVDEIETELMRLRSIAEAILRIARLEASQGSLGFSRIPLAPLLADLAETFGPVAEEKGQSLSLESVATDLSVTGDAAMLSQLLANLIQNAINHCPAGTAITMGAAAANGTPRLWVADTGPGIPESERERVFELFYRIDPNRTGDGTGLGLALVRAIATRLGARVELSDAGPGLRVDVLFAAH